MRCPFPAINYCCSTTEPAAFFSNRREKHAITALLANISSIWVLAELPRFGNYADPSVYSPFCSSVYEDAPNNYLIDYTQAGPYIYAGIVYLDPSGYVGFTYQYELL